MNPASATFRLFDARRVPSPCFVVDEVAIENNLKILARVQVESGARILLALKAFSMFSLAPLIRQYLQGCCASGLHEARLAREEYGGEVHTFSAAFKESELDEILTLSDHLVLNSVSQWQRFKERLHAAKQLKPSLQFGLRVNPQHSEGATAIYDPCAPCSRLGIPIDQLKQSDLSGVDGLHFHTLCQQTFAPLARTLDVIERELGEQLKKMKWVNFGGGHHITAANYQVDALIERIKMFQDKYDVQVYLEPGEAIAINAGVLISEVLDITYNDTRIAILDTSATCHMPDTLEMPYRPYILASDEKNHKGFSYRIGGQTCLAGDVIGDYSFDNPLAIGDRLIFDDMAHYTMVKTSTFNGINLPAIAVWNSQTDQVKIIKEFGYLDFKSRLS